MAPSVKVISAMIFIVMRSWQPSSPSPSSYIRLSVISRFLQFPKPIESRGLLASFGMCLAPGTAPRQSIKGNTTLRTLMTPKQGPRAVTSCDSQNEAVRSVYGLGSHQDVLGRQERLQVQCTADPLTMLGHEADNRGSQKTSVGLKTV